MNICIIEDNKLEADYVNKMTLDACKELKISEPNIFIFYSSVDFYKWLHEGNTIDACFLDIDLQCEDNGIEIAKKIKEKDFKTLIIFTTSYDNYFREMVQVEPFRFLSKPFQYTDFYKVFMDIYKRIILRKSESDCIYQFKNNGVIFSADLRNITCFSSYKRKIIISDIQNQNMEFYGKLDDVEMEVRTITNKFVRINKSYLFNRDYIDVWGRNFISIGGLEYQISPKYKNNI